MTTTPLRTPQACLERAVVLMAEAEELAALPNEWYAVCYFYAAYHTVRAALLRDPIFGDLSRLKAVNQHFTPDDRWNDHHRARKGPAGSAGPGVSDLVNALYIEVQVEYARLHSASIAVRYGLGLAAYRQSDLQSDFTTIARAAVDGKLVAS